MVLPKILAEGKMAIVQDSAQYEVHIGRGFLDEINGRAKDAHSQGRETFIALSGHHEEIEEGKRRIVVTDFHEFSPELSTRDEKRNKTVFRLQDAAQELEDISEDIIGMSHIHVKPLNKNQIPRNIQNQEIVQEYEINAAKRKDQRNLQLPSYNDVGFIDGMTEEGKSGIIVMHHPEKEPEFYLVRPGGDMEKIKPKILD